MISKSSSNLQKFFVESNSKFPQLASKESFYSEQSHQSSRDSQQQVSSKSKQARPKTVKTEIEHFFLKKKGDVEAFALNPQLGHVFHAKKRVIKVYKNGQTIQVIDVERHLNDEVEQKESELFSEMVQEIMNVSIESVEEDESLLHFTHSRRQRLEESGLSVSHRLSRLIQSRPPKRQRLKNLDLGMMTQTGTKSLLGKESLKSTEQVQAGSNGGSLHSNQGGEAFPETNETGELSEPIVHDSLGKSIMDVSLDSHYKPKWRISCIASVHHYLMVGFIKLDQVLIYKMTLKGGYEYSGKIDLKISKGFYKVIDMDYNPNSSYLCLVYSKFNLNDLTNESPGQEPVGQTIEYGLINLTMLDAIKYSSKSANRTSPGVLPQVRPMGRALGTHHPVRGVDRQPAHGERLSRPNRQNPLRCGQGRGQVRAVDSEQEPVHRHPPDRLPAGAGLQGGLPRVLLPEQQPAPDFRDLLQAVLAGEVLEPGGHAGGGQRERGDHLRPVHLPTDPLDRGAHERHP